MHTRLVAAVVLLAYGHAATAADLDLPPIAYSTAPADNAVTRLERQLKAGTVQLAADDRHGYLKSFLAALDVPVSSQVLVFSRTSLQRARIGPRTPRAIYFNDDVTVGFCRGGEVVEVAAADRNLGTVFYTLDQRADRPARITRQTESCLFCHGSSANHGFPGHLVRSVSVDPQGEPGVLRASIRVDHTTPLEDRWGGWYVTGTSGAQEHQGNRVVGGWPWAAKDRPPGGANVTDLRPYFPVTDYLSPHSDLVALMVLEHQAEAHNRLTRANFQTRLAVHEQAERNKTAGGTTRGTVDDTEQRIHQACEPVVRYLLFCDEAKLTGPVAGTSGFAREFAARGPFDPRGRSLREFDLRTRMFRYPLSYVIYSRQFDGLPAAAKDRIYRRLWEVLTGEDASKEFAHLTADDRRAVLEILRDTKPGLPDYWKK